MRCGCTLTGCDRLNITRYARQLTLVEFGDSHTERLLGNTNEIAFGLVPPEVVGNVGKVRSRSRLAVSACTSGTL